MSKVIVLKTGQETVVDYDDYDRLRKFKCHLKGGRYATCHPKKGMHALMHRLIIDIPDGMETDHIDGNVLNNQKSNLRAVTHRENCQNLHPKKYKKVSKFPGVSFHNLTKKWYPRARVGIGGLKVKSSGYYDTEEEAYCEYLKLIK